jgi:lysophospholipase L1-like esterase
LVLVFLILGFAEGGGRVYIWMKYGVPGKTYGLWQADPELGAIHASNAYNTQTQTNNYGFRGKEDVVDPKPGGSTRVICYGGSTTFCYNLEDGEAWPQRLQDNLRARPGHDKDQVLNGGHICWSLGHVYLQAKRDLPAQKPDVVVLYVGVNEEMNSAYLKDGGYKLDELKREQLWGVVAKNYDQCRWLKRNSVLVRFFDYRVKSLLKSAMQSGQSAPPGEAGPEGTGVAAGNSGKQLDDEFESSWEWQNYAVMLGRMIDLIRENGATPVFVVECATEERARNSDILRYSPLGAELMRQRGVAVCDPRTAFARDGRGTALFYATGVHVSAEGARLLAQEVSQAIDSLPPHGAVPAPGP